MPRVVNMPELSVDQQIETFLATCKTASLATVDAHGQPCNANIQYVSDSAYRLYWVSSMSSAHSLNLAAKPKAAVTIYAHQDQPDLIHGLQLGGTAVMIQEDQLEDTYKRYTAKYPFVTDPPFDKAMKLQQFYCFTPTWLRWIDNRKEFGWKVEKALD